MQVTTKGYIPWYTCKIKVTKKFEWKITILIYKHVELWSDIEYE
jgi:hypothetical protein